MIIFVGGHAIGDIRVVYGGKKRGTAVSACRITQSDLNGGGGLGVVEDRKTRRRERARGGEETKKEKRRRCEVVIRFSSAVVRVSGNVSREPFELCPV